MIPFNKPTHIGIEEQHVFEAINNNKLCGDGPFGKKCQEWFESKLPCIKALMTPSCTHALELAAILIDIQPDDEVIMPSYTFVSTANAFVLRGAKIVFVDIRPDTMNIDELKIEAAITNKTKAIIVVHYAGVSCEMNKIMELSDKYKLFVIEDAAQGMMSTYKGKSLGTIGHLGTFSFHETKNYTSGGEGGLLILNDKNLKDRAEIIREKGTNRSQFFMGMVDKYSWVDIGSSYLPSELQSAYLWAQLQKADEINNKRLQLWNRYYNNLLTLNNSYIQLPSVPNDCKHNAHMFYIKLEDLESRNKFIDYLKLHNIQSVFHYIPLHTAPVSTKYSRFNGIDQFTTKESERIVRLPMFYKLTIPEVDHITDVIKGYFVEHS